MKPIGSLAARLCIAALSATLFCHQPCSAHERDRSGDLRASILLREPLRGQQPRLKEVDAAETFYSGDRLQFRVHSERDGYLYALLRDSQGARELLYPYDAEQNTASNRIRAAQTVTIPDADFFRLDDSPGTEQVFVLVSSRPIEALEQLARKPGEVPARLFDELTAQAGNGKGILPPGASKDELRLEFLALPISLRHEP